MSTNKRTRGKVTNYTMNLAADKGQGTNWDFEVHQEELRTAGGVASGIHAVIRNDTGAVIGDYRGQKMTAYREIVETFENGLTKSGLQFTRELIVTGNGARFYGTYNVGSFAIHGEEFENVLRLQSSHDGSLKVGFNYSGRKLACLNAMEVMKVIYVMMKKHSRTIDLAFLTSEIDNAIQAGQNSLTMLVNQMLAVTLNDGQVENILANLVDMGGKVGVSPRLAYVVNNYWHNPQHDENDFGNTLYRLYNCITRFTRDVANAKRFEMSQRANRYVTGALDLAVQRPHDMARLLAVPANALDFKGVTVTI